MWVFEVMGLREDEVWVTPSSHSLGVFEGVAREKPERGEASPPIGGADGGVPQGMILVVSVRVWTECGESMRGRWHFLRSARGDARPLAGEGRRAFRGGFR